MARKAKVNDTKKSSVSVTKKSPVSKVKNSVEKSERLEYIFTSPEGYVEARSADDFFDPVNWATTPEVRGTVISVYEVDKKKPKKGEATTTRVLSFVDEEKVGWSIWEKKQLETLFNVVVPGCKIIITHTGVQEIKGRALPMHKFRCLYQQPQK